jgi:hypothetical protein
VKRSLATLGLALLVGMGCASEHHRHGSRRLSSSEIADAEILKISALVDGSGFIEFTPQSVRYHHLNWQPPVDVTFDGEQWQNLDQTPTSWSDNGRQLDLSRAQIVQRKGRDVIALERTEAGFDLYLDDSPNGSGQYEVTIAIPWRKALRNIPKTGQ